MNHDKQDNPNTTVTLLSIQDRLNLAIETLQATLKTCQAMMIKAEQAEQAEQPAHPESPQAIRRRILKLQEMLSQASIYDAYLNDIQAGRIVESTYRAATLNTIYSFSRRITALLSH